MRFVDRAPVGGTRRTDDGYLVADVRTARTGIQWYLGREVGLPDRDYVAVFRPEEEVFKKDSLRTYAHKPVTVDHPPEQVSADNWSDYAVGNVGDEIARDGDYVRVPLVVMDAKAIKEIEEGKRELSAGYDCILDWTPGVAPDGTKYDAVQRDIRINHVAVVDRGRAGPDARIGDSASDKPSWGARSFDRPATNAKDGMKGIRSMTTRTITVDGLSVELADRDAQIVQRHIERLTDSVAELNKKLSDAQAAHDAAVAAKDGEIAKRDADIAKRDAELEELRKKLPDAATLDRLAAARADLIAKARAVLPDVKTDGLSDSEIRRAVVVGKLGEEVVRDKSEAYVDARFDVLVETAAPQDELRDALTVRTPAVSNDAASAEERAFSASIENLNSWRKEA